MRYSVILSVACCVVYAGAANGQRAKGVVTITTINDGNYNDTNTWTGGNIPNGPSEAADIVHNVTVTDTQSCVDGVISAGGSLTIEPGGSLTHTSLTIVGPGSAGTLTIEGTGVHVTPILSIDTVGTLAIRPTANGAPGLTPIDATAGFFSLETGSTFELDTSLYAPTIGDSWVIANASVVNGIFDNVVAPEGVTVVITGAKGVSSVIVTVNAVPVAAPSGVPAASSWGLGALCVSLALCMAFYMRRQRRLKSV